MNINKPLLTALVAVSLFAVGAFAQRGAGAVEEAKDELQFKYTVSGDFNLVIAQDKDIDDMFEKTDADIGTMTITAELGGWDVEITSVNGGLLKNNDGNALQYVNSGTNDDVVITLSLDVNSTAAALLDVTEKAYDMVLVGTNTSTDPTHYLLSDVFGKAQGTFPAMSGDATITIKGGVTVSEESVKNAGNAISADAGDYEETILFTLYSCYNL